MNVERETRQYETITDCQAYFNLKLPVELLSRHYENFFIENAFLEMPKCRFLEQYLLSRSCLIFGFMLLLISLH